MVCGEDPSRVPNVNASCCALLLDTRNYKVARKNWLQSFKNALRPVFSFPPSLLSLIILVFNSYSAISLMVAMHS